MLDYRVSPCADGKKEAYRLLEALLCERFLAYLIYRHASPAEGEADFRLGVGLALLITEIFAALIGGEKGVLPVQAARILSEELEYSEENTDVIRRFLARAID